MRHPKVGRRPGRSQTAHCSYRETGADGRERLLSDRGAAVLPLSQMLNEQLLHLFLLRLPIFKCKSSSYYSVEGGCEPLLGIEEGSRMQAARGGRTERRMRSTSMFTPSSSSLHLHHRSPSGNCYDFDSATFCGIIGVALKNSSTSEMNIRRMVR